MIDIRRKIIKRIHPEGIPAPVSNIYNILTKTGIFQEHYALVATELKKYCRKGKLADIGTGPGWLLLAIHKASPQLQLSGVDISHAMINKAKYNLHKKNNCKDIELLLGSVTELPYENNSIDCIVSTGSMHHWKDMEKGLTEIHRVLKKNSFALIYDLTLKIPDDIFKESVKKFGRYRMTLLWLHSFEEPFYSREEMESLPVNTPFKKGKTHFTGAICCLELRK